MFRRRKTKKAARDKNDDLDEDNEEGNSNTLQSIFNGDLLISQDLCSISLLRHGVHAFLVYEYVNISEEESQLQRVVCKTEFCPRKNDDRMVGKGFVHTEVYATNEAIRELKHCKAFPSWSIPKSVVDGALSKIIRESKNSPPNYSCAGTDSTDSSRKEKIEVHNCLTWCEKVLTEAGITKNFALGWLPVKLPNIIVWNEKRIQDKLP